MASGDLESLYAASNPGGGLDPARNLLETYFRWVGSK